MPNKATIDRRLWPEVFKNQDTSVAQATQSIADDKMAIGQSEGLVAMAVSQPALSQQLREVEDMLGTVLFLRHRRHIGPPTGHATLERSRCAQCHEVALRPTMPACTPPSDTIIPYRRDLPRGRQLVSAAWLAALMQGRAPECAPTGPWHLFEVGEDAAHSYIQAHLPGAGYIDTHWLEAPPLWQALPLDQLQACVRRLGLGGDSTVVLYGHTTAAAARAALLLMVAGVQDVRLLDGGFSAWLNTGGAVRSGPHQVTLTNGSMPAALRPCPQYLLQTPELRLALRDARTRLVSIRTWNEFLGRTSGYSYIAARGEIPGAVWGHAGDDGDMHSVSSFQLPDGRMRPAAEIAALWADVGVQPTDPTIFYCGTGWRASVAFFYAWVMGWQHIRVYDGGWLAWSSDPANPVVLRNHTPAAEGALSLAA